MNLDPDACYRALLARDRRFDGAFFVAVRSTGIYCRPICPAKTPRRDRCAFFRCGAAAERAGYRACLRCRPELAPGGAPVDAVPHLVKRAVARIHAGALNDAGVDALASSLGVTDRHLRRAMEAELGTTPVELAQSRRIALAKQLLHDSALSLAEIAFASGFNSVRRFNALFLQRFGRAPSALRRAVNAGASTRAPATILLRLDYRPPLAWDRLLAFLAARAIPGVERVQDGVYERTVRIGTASGTVSVEPDARRPALRAHVSVSLAGSLMAVASRLRTLFDLDANPSVIDAHLARSRKLATLVAARPGLRVPGAFDPFETTVRAVLGQQVSVKAATTLAGRVAERFGTRIPGAGAPDLVFPDAALLAAAPPGALAAIGLPKQRAATLAGLAGAVARGTLDLSPDRPPADVLAELESLPGFGPWTRHYVAMRALHDPDAFPAGDLGVRKALGGSAADAARAAERWSPWRAYAVMHLWSSLSGHDEETR